MLLIQQYLDIFIESSLLEFIPFKRSPIESLLCLVLATKDKVRGAIRRDRVDSCERLAWVWFLTPSDITEYSRVVSWLEQDSRRTRDKSSSLVLIKQENLQRKQSLGDLVSIWVEISLYLLPWSGWRVQCCFSFYLLFFICPLPSGFNCWKKPDCFKWEETANEAWAAFKRGVVGGGGRVLCWGGNPDGRRKERRNYNTVSRLAWTENWLLGIKERTRKWG